MKFVNFLKSRLIFNIFYFSECLQTNFSYISREHIPRTKRRFNLKSSTDSFHMKTKILAEFHICVSVPLRTLIWHIRRSMTFLLRHHLYSLKTRCESERILSIKNMLNLKMKSLTHGIPTELTEQDQRTILFTETRNVHLQFLPYNTTNISHIFLVLQLLI